MTSANLAGMLFDVARHRPEHPVLRTADAVVTYAELAEGAARVAGGLRELGLRRGDRVGVQLPNGPAFLQAWFGILHAGLVMVPLNPMLRAAELAHILTDSGASLVITTAASLPELRAVPDLRMPVLITDEAADADARPFAELLRSEPAEATEVSPDDVALVIYTSGTTGHPKGAQLTHHGLLVNCTTAGGIFGVRGDDVSLAVLPFFHVYGLSGVVDVAIRYGATLVVLPKYSAQAAAQAMSDHRVSIFAGVPTMFHGLLGADLSGLDLSPLRAASSGGGSLPGAVLDAFEERFGVQILEGYGLSETGSAAMMNVPGQRRVGSVGSPIDGVSARIVDADGGLLPCGAEHIGEIVLRGPNVMTGYLGDAPATARALRDGWLHTGDLGYCDEDGFYFIVDRIGDLIIRGGYNVYPREVEETLHRMPGIAMAAVIGRPDERLGEEIVAVIVPQAGAEPTSEAIADWCRDRLAAYKCPRVIEFRNALPMSDSGKVLKRMLR